MPISTGLDKRSRCIEISRGGSALAFIYAIPFLN